MGIFFDVPADAYCAKAVAWIVENVAYTGMGGGKFSPDATCMRAQAVTFLQRAMFTVGRNKKAIKAYIQNQLQEDQIADQVSIKEFIDPFTGSKNIKA